MAAQSANVTSIDAPRQFRAALVRFVEEMESALVTLDLEGFRSGSLNDLVGLDTRRLFSQTPNHE